MRSFGSLLLIIAILALAIFALSRNNEKSDHKPVNTVGSPGAPKSVEIPFDKLVLEAKGPVLVDFGAPWCVYCRKLDPIIDNLSREYQVLQINVEEFPDLAARYRVSGLPHLILFNEGKIVQQFRGWQSEAVLRSALMAASQKG